MREAFWAAQVKTVLSWPTGALSPVGPAALEAALAAAPLQRAQEDARPGMSLLQRSVHSGEGLRASLAHRASSCWTLSCTGPLDAGLCSIRWCTMLL